MNVIEATGLGKRYGLKRALRDCTVWVPQGHVTGLVGPNGAGKTTLLSMAVGLVAPTTGTAHLHRMRELTDLKQKGTLIDSLLADHGLFHLEADLRWIDLTTARLDELAAEVRSERSEQS